MFVLCGFIFSADCHSAWTSIISRTSKRSLVKQDGKVIGSKLIGQQWTELKYFHGPSVQSITI